jgi:hypothetical protein
MEKRSPRKITINLMGGLGNQLLQYATALSLSQKLESQIVLNSYLLTRSPVNSSAEKRELEIMQFAHTGNIQNLGKIQTFRSMVFGRIGWIAHRRPILGNLWVRTPNFFSSVRNLQKRNLHLTGFFTSYLYFQDVLPILLKQIDQLAHTSDWFRDELLDLENEKFYAIHIRRGDYENLTDHFGLLSGNYYLSAVNGLIDNYGLKPIYVFSDDIKKARSLFCDFPFEVSYVEPSADSTALESLVLMSKSCGLVIANSTFSWWAGILSTGSTPVLYPKPFLKNEKFETRDFFPKNWHPIKHTF